MLDALSSGGDLNRVVAVIAAAIIELETAVLGE